MADEESGLRHDVSHNFTGVLLTVPSEPQEFNPFYPFEYGQIRPQASSNTEENRQRFNENQEIAAREAASMVAAGSTMLLLFVGALVLTYFVTGLLFFVIGCSSFIESADKSCDQPLRWWLLMMLLVVGFEKLIQCYSESSARTTFTMFSVKICLLCLGFWWRSKCVTCAETSPDLYQFVTMYLIYKLVSAVSSALLPCVGVSFMVWMIGNDIGPFASRQAAGRPGLIQELQTVVYTPELFQQGDANLEKEPPECSICQDEFNAEKVIKMTPCGHYFHEECLEMWLSKYAKSCPLCRQNLEDAADAAKT